MARPWIGRGWPSESTHTVAAVGRLVAVVWLCGLLLHVALLIRHGRRLRGIVARASDPGAELLKEHEAMARRLGLDRAPRLLESREVVVPQLVGARRPTVLMPADTAAQLSSRERAIVLGHELMHVQRRDLALAWVPVGAERLLVWHPLAWFAAREYALAREAACDHAVLDVLDVDAADYGRLLVRLGVGRPIRGTVAAGASPGFRLLRRRLMMLQHITSGSSLTARIGSLAAALIVSALPLRVVAGSHGSSEAMAPYDAVASSAPAPAAPARASVAPQRQAAATRPRQAPADRRDDASWLESWVYLNDDDVSMNGDSDDLQAARAARSAGSAPVFVFQREGRRYLLADAPMLQQVNAILEPMRELGRQQGELGERQGKLGEAQGGLGEKQGALGERQGQLGAKQAEISAQLMVRQAEVLEAAARRMRAGPSNDETRRAEREAQARSADAKREISALGAQQSTLGEEQAALGREQAKLGEQQAKLGEEQGRLGEQQGQASRKTEGELRALAERAVAQGLAREIGK